MAPRACLCDTLTRLRDCLLRKPPIRDFDAAIMVTLCCYAGPRVIMIERSLDPRDPWAGDMAFPGGHREPSDSSPLDTALREAYEETCLEPSSFEILGFLPAASPKRITVRVVPVVSVLRTRHCPVETLRQCSSEETRRLTLVPLPFRVEKRLLMHRFRGTLVEGYKTWYGDVIWGMSLRVLEELVERLRRCNIEYVI